MRCVDPPCSMCEFVTCFPKKAHIVDIGTRSGSRYECQSICFACLIWWIQRTTHLKHHVRVLFYLK